MRVVDSTPNSFQEVSSLTHQRNKTIHEDSSHSMSSSARLWYFSSRAASKFWARYDGCAQCCVTNKYESITFKFKVLIYCSVAILFKLFILPYFYVKAGI